jgi:phosphate transport system substrate-binding protein
MEGVAINLAAQSYPKGDALSDALAQDVNGIGYVSLPSVKNNKTVSISEGENLTAFYPNPFTIATEDYPLSRRLYTYHLPTAKEEAKKFIEFCLSDEGEQIASQTGFVGLNLSTQSQVAALPNTQIPQEYKTITQNAVRENFNIHFISGSAAIDNKATQDLYHFSQQYGHLPPEKQIRLIGFTDNVGNPSQNLSLSKERAGAVAKTLQNYGMKADIKSFGLGQQMPIGNNATIQGKDKNRRVEVWIK